MNIHEAMNHISDILYMNEFIVVALRVFFFM